MLRYEKIERDIRRALIGSAALEYCIGILNYIITSDEQLSRHLTYRHIGTILSVDPADDSLHAAVTLLSSRFRALHFRMEFFDESGEVYDLTESELRGFLATGELAHPHTGQPIESPGNLLVPYFAAFKADLLAEDRRD